MLRRADDELAVKHIANARQMIWAVKPVLQVAGLTESALDLDAAEQRLIEATLRLTHQREITYQEAEETMPDIKLLTDTGRRTALSVPMAEIISRAWQVVALIEDMRVDLGKHVRQSQARELAIGAFTTALSHLVMGAQLMVPSSYLHAKANVMPDAEAPQAGLGAE